MQGRMRISYEKILLLLLLPILIYFHFHGIVLQEEGYILNSTERIVKGLVVYRDFEFIYTPFSIFLTALSFKIFGISILSSRILITIVSLLSLYFVFKIILLSTNNKLYATLAMLLYLTWGPTHTNFISPLMFAILFSLSAIYSLLKFLKTRKLRFLLFAGILSFLTFLSHQFFGIIIILAIITFFMTQSSRNFKYLLTFAYGYLWSFIFFCIYLLTTDSFKPFINNMKSYAISQIFTNNLFFNSITINNLGFNLLSINGLYIIAATISLYALILTYYRRRFHLIFISSYLLSLYFFSIWLKTTTAHITSLLSLTGISLSLSIRYTVNSYSRILLMLFYILMISSGLYTSIYNNYYDTSSTIIQSKYFYQSPKANIFITDSILKDLRVLKNIINQPALLIGDIYTDPTSQILYFLLDRDDPINKTWPGINRNSDLYFHEVIGNLVAKDIKLIILNKKAEPNLQFKKFIFKKYHLKKSIDGYDAYIKNP